jgi:hypothetical protein
MQRNGLLNYSPTVGKRDPAQVEAVQVQDVERMILQLAWRVADGKLDRIEVGVPSGFWTITSPSSTTLCAGILDAALQSGADAAVQSSPLRVNILAAPPRLWS